MTFDASPDYDDIPSADPQILKDYEAALGEFLVVFNRIENMVSDIIFLALKKAERKDILGTISGDSFSRKVTNLELIALRFPEAASSSLIKELRGLGRERNDLAHGHFDQNPYDGSYHVVTDRKRLTMPVQAIRGLTQRAEDAYQKLREAQLSFWFDDLGPEEDDTASVNESSSQS